MKLFLSLERIGSTGLLWHTTGTNGDVVDPLSESISVQRMPLPSTPRSSEFFVQILKENNSWRKQDLLPKLQNKVNPKIELDERLAAHLAGSSVAGVPRAGNLCVSWGASSSEPTDATRALFV